MLLLLLLLLLLLASDGELAGRDRDLGLEEILDTSRHGRPDPRGQLRSEALRRDDRGGRVRLDLDHPGEGGRGDRLGGQLGHGRHVAGQALRQTGRRVGLDGSRRAAGGAAAATQLGRQ